ncbi:MAG TPA: BatA domain-containing protein, partial [Gemmatimonadaceae bacterium]|nr:BatA domain-containing protein [Gemmatimonadaceae bacterium]
MSFLAPWFLVAALGVSAIVVALHLLARQRPRVAPLPTARFVPERPAVAPSRSRRPTDLLLLAMRVAAVLLAGTAFARPHLGGERRAVARVVLLDLSRAVASLDEARDSAAALLAPGDLLVTFDSTARVAHAWEVNGDSLGALALSRSPGSLSAAVVAALRGAASLRNRADSLELAIVSPLVSEEADSATLLLRALWPGRARLVRIASASDDGEGIAIDLRAEPDDPLIATVALLGGSRVRAPSRLVRIGARAADSAWVRDSAGVLVVWAAQAEQMTGDVAKGSASAVAVATPGVTVVAPFTRSALPAAGRAVAWWNDGTPAASERDHGAGCIRDVAIGVPAAGDLVLR